ncbi:acyltransferase [Mucilaginibacter sp. AW1-7]|jgi:surface polysaccharide O-acyltransferase-like enzyme|uniref:acyltransferase family protein n=1 Tax=unclassified Mucilaginibacter TaxID=2617802 RepID=UPI0023650276|nr:acyltransferase [Mucilaginibacter sp. KACC 22773]WDF76287.1 acyltransferase [Mucilaginibacter sp. KACC 22773]
MQTETGIPATANSNSAKIGYVDNLKVVLTVLVIMHHAFITYGAPGGWYLTEKTTLKAALIPMTLFVATNQAFFMGFFFFLSAYFTESSYNKKGTLKFLGDRLKRLGIPLIFYSFILSPVLSYLVYRFAQGNNITYLQFLSGFHPWINFGVLWFVAALLLFSVLYVVVRFWFDKKPGVVNPMPPGGRKIILFTAALALASYFVRWVFPVGWILKPVGFQLGHFAQYVALFALGIIASRGRWLNNVNYQLGKSFAIVALAMIVVLFPVLYAVVTITQSPIETLNGHGSWQSLMYAFWEQFTGIFIIVALLGIARQRWNNQSVFFKKLSRLTFCVYIFHPLVLISLSVLLKPWAVDPAFKLLVVAPGAVVGSFLLAAVLVKVPGVKAIV